VFDKLNKVNKNIKYCIAICTSLNITTNGRKVFFARLYCVRNKKTRENIVLLFLVPHARGLCKFYIDLICKMG